MKLTDSPSGILWGHQDDQKTMSTNFRGGGGIMTIEFSKDKLKALYKELERAEQLNNPDYNGLRGA